MISIICIVYNGEKYIEEAIDSVLGQTFKNYEIIVIDDGSSDSTLKILEKYTCIPNFRLIKFCHIGNPGKLRNEAIKLSKFNIISFIDADDVWFEDKLEKQMIYINEGYEMVCSNAERIFEGNALIYPIVASVSRIVFGDNRKTDIPKYCFTDIKNDVDLELKELLKMNYVVTSSVVITKKAVTIAGYFEEDLGRKGEDYLLWLNVSKKYKIRYISAPLIYYRIHSNNLSLQTYKERLELLDRTIDIRNNYLNSTDSEIRSSAREGLVPIYHELSKLTMSNHEYQSSFRYWKLFVRNYNKKISIKYIKHILVLCYLFLLSSFTKGELKVKDQIHI